MVILASALPRAFADGIVGDIIFLITSSGDALVCFGAPANVNAEMPPAITMPVAIIAISAFFFIALSPKDGKDPKADDAEAAKRYLRDAKHEAENTNSHASRNRYSFALSALAPQTFLDHVRIEHRLAL
jgi:hypothetical protein